ncbi:hypothetical protein BT63DRAFT_453225 [Microthyrium microscopicum]|uniref:Uncharacterized protein n=1 Tax=Microthyrium microscopicum TaxID=703497 RepID=A0A6A6UGQ5_9PEZI|nr:hypothetical protein BT63DRAFT_453225 [Microthyrium microscopicum]
MNSSPRPLDDMAFIALLSRTPVEIQMLVLRECFPPFEPYEHDREGFMIDDFKYQVQSALSLMSSSPLLLSVLWSGRNYLCTSIAMYPRGYLISAEYEPLAHLTSLILTASPTTAADFTSEDFGSGQPSLFGKFVAAHIGDHSLEKSLAYVDSVIEAVSLGKSIAKVILDYPHVGSTYRCFGQPIRSHFTEDKPVVVTHRITRAIFRIQLYIAMTQWGTRLTDKQIIDWTFFSNFMPHATLFHRYSQVREVLELLEWLQYLHIRFATPKFMDGTGGTLRTILSSRLNGSLNRSPIPAPRIQNSDEQQPRFSTVTDRLHIELSKYTKKIRSLFIPPPHRNQLEWPFETCPISNIRGTSGHLVGPGHYCIHRYFPVINKRSGKPKGPHGTTPPIIINRGSRSIQEPEDVIISARDFAYQPTFDGFLGWQDINTHVQERFVLKTAQYKRWIKVQGLESWPDQRYGKFAWFYMKPFRPPELSLSPAYHKILDLEFATGIMRQKALEVAWGVDHLGKFASEGYHAGPDRFEAVENSVDSTRDRWDRPHWTRSKSLYGLGERDAAGESEPPY